MIKLSPIVYESRKALEYRDNRLFASKLCKLSTRHYGYILTKELSYTPTVGMSASEKVADYVMEELLKSNKHLVMYREVASSYEKLENDTVIGYSMDFVLKEKTQYMFIEHKSFIGEKSEDFVGSFLFNRTMAQLYLYYILSRGKKCFTEYIKKKSVKIPLAGRTYVAMFTLSDGVYMYELNPSYPVTDLFHEILNDQVEMLRNIVKFQDWSGTTIHRDKYFQVIEDMKPYNSEPIIINERAK